MGGGRIRKRTLRGIKCSGVDGIGFMLGILSIRGSVLVDEVVVRSLCIFVLGNVVDLFVRLRGRVEGLLVEVVLLRCSHDGKNGLEGLVSVGLRV